MIYENQECPVCKRAFEDGDDIVCCPDCGTPHHRECYNLIGHCVNKGLHKSNYSYYEEHANKEAVPEGDEQNKPEEEKDSAQGGVFPPFPAAAIDFTKNPYDNDKEKIDGESAGDIATAVRSNVPRFMKIFHRQEQTKAKTGWNWGAFFFSHYYLFFRKMYKQAITLFCVNITISSVLNLLVMKLAPLTVEAIGELQRLASATTDSAALLEKVNSIQGLSDFSTFRNIYLAFTALMLLIRITVAVFADGMYKHTVTDMIKKINEQLESGAAFSTPTLTPTEEETFNLSQEQLRRLYLAKRGGVSVWAPCAAYIFSYLISMLIG